MTNTVFVYGTLKRNHSNNYLLKDSEFIGKATTKYPYLLIDDYLPFLIKDSCHDCSRIIKGELYEITDDVFKRLDDLEGHPNFYKRQCIWVVNKNKMIYTWCYFLNDGLTYNENCFVDSGEWGDILCFH